MPTKNLAWFCSCLWSKPHWTVWTYRLTWRRTTYALWILNAKKQWWGDGALEVKVNARHEWIASFQWGASLSKLDSNFSAVLWYEPCGPCSRCWGQRSLPSLFGWLADWFIPLLFFKPSILHALVNILVSRTSVGSVCVYVCACVRAHVLHFICWMQ